MTMRLWIHFALLASVVASASSLAASKPIRLKEDEGIIVYRVKCGPGIAWAQFYRSGESAKGYRAEARRAGMLNCPDGVQIQKAKAGHYFVGKVGFQGVVDFSEETATQFDVAAGKLNYIGHIALPSSFDKGEGLGRVLISDPFVIDRREEALAWLATNQADPYREYEFVAGVARAPGKLIANELEEPGSQSGETALTVILKLRVGANGSVREGHIAKPSGNDIVDETALSEAVRNWMLTPAIENGTPVEKWGNYSVTYRRTN